VRGDKTCVAAAAIAPHPKLSLRANFDLFPQLREEVKRSPAVVYLSHSVAISQSAIADV
jgi:hypothetical protein